MRKLLAIAVAALLTLSSFAQPQQTVPTSEIVRAANNFLATLNAEQRQKVLYAFDDATQLRKFVAGRIFQARERKFRARN